MSTTSLLRGMAENNAWSNLRLHAACAELSESDYLATRTSFFPSIHATLVHIMLVDEYYLDALVGGGRGRSIFDQMASLTRFEQVRVAQRAVDLRLVDFVASLEGDAALARIAEIPRRDHVARERVDAILQHVFVHQIHHRGQAHAMLAGTPAKPPQLDEFFLDEDAPLRAGELRALGLPVR